MPRCDALVIGAGVSGLVSSIVLAKKGYKVIVIEKCKQVGQHTKTKIDITESSGVEEIVKELKLPVLDNSHTSKWFSRNNSFTYVSKDKDLFVKRGPEPDSFDRVAYKNAKNKGTEFLFNAHPKSFNFKAGFLDSVSIKINNKTESVKPKFVIGADGSNSVSAKLAQLDNPQSQKTKIIGYGITAKNLNMPNSTTHVLFDSEFAPGGYFFMAKTKRKLGVASVVVNADKIKENIKTYFDLFTKKNKMINSFIKGNKIKNYFVGSCETYSLKSRTRNNFLLAGDAARVMDPLFAYGVRPAILSGYLAAQTIHKNLEDDKCDLAEYEANIKKELLSYEQFNLWARKILNKINNADIDLLINLAKYLQKNNKLDLAFEDTFACKTDLLKFCLKNPIKSANFFSHAVF